MMDETMEEIEEEVKLGAYQWPVKFTEYNVTVAPQRREWAAAKHRTPSSNHTANLQITM